MPACTDPTDPAFEHGPRGYKNGCRATNPCPGKPTCAALKAADMRAYRKRGGYKTTHADGRKTVYVTKRLRETLEVVTVADLAALTGVPAGRILRLSTSTGKGRTVRVPEDLAAPLDAAWARLVHHQDVTSIPADQHGRLVTYTGRCCRCRRCCDAQTRYNKSRGLTSNAHKGLTDVTAELQAHVAALADAAGGVAAVARATGVSKSVILRVVHAGPDAKMVRGNAARLLAARPSALLVRMPRTGRTSAKDTLHRVRTLSALGYPNSWVLDQLAATGVHTYATVLRASKTVPIAVHRAVEALAEQVGDTPATPGDGLTAAQIRNTRSKAREFGHYPPEFYDDNGVLNPRLFPDHPWADLDRRADEMLLAANLVIRGATYAETAAQLGIAERTVGRYVKRLGLTFETNQQGIDRAASYEAITRFKEVYSDHVGHLLGPVEAALTLGLLDVATICGSSRVQAEHPEVRAWAADNEPEQVAA